MILSPPPPLFPPLQKKNGHGDGNTPSLHILLLPDRYGSRLPISHYYRTVKAKVIAMSYWLNRWSGEQDGCFGHKFNFRIWERERGRILGSRSMRMLILLLFRERKKMWEKEWMRNNKEKMEESMNTRPDILRLSSSTSSAFAYFPACFLPFAKRNLFPTLFITLCNNLLLLCLNLSLVAGSQTRSLPILLFI